MINIDIEKHRNKDGTINGISAIAEMSGLSEKEIAWTFNRGKQLKAKGMSREEIARTLKKEASSKFGGK